LPGGYPLVIVGSDVGGVEGGLGLNIETNAGVRGPADEGGSLGDIHGGRRVREDFFPFLFLPLYLTFLTFALE
jgi:hypothetical protein